MQVCSIEGGVQGGSLESLESEGDKTGFEEEQPVALLQVYPGSGHFVPEGENHGEQEEHVGLQQEEVLEQAAQQEEVLLDAQSSIRETTGLLLPVEQPFLLPEHAFVL